jgi:hypothetical protein
MVLGSTQNLREMSTWVVLGGTWRLERKGDNFTAISEPIFSKIRELRNLKPHESPWPIAGMSLYFSFHLTSWMEYSKRL